MLSRSSFALCLALLPWSWACAKASPEQQPSGGPAREPAENQQQPTSLRSDIETMDAATARRALLDATRRLGDTLALAAPDCEQARMLRDRICELSARICRLADKQGTSAELASDCEDGKTRCEDARRRVGMQCP